MTHKSGHGSLMDFAGGSASREKVERLFESARSIVDRTARTPPSLIDDEIAVCGAPEAEVKAAIAHAWTTGMLPDPRPSHAACRAAAAWLRLEARSRLLAAVLVGFGLNDRHYGRPDRNEEGRSWYVKVAMGKNPPNFDDLLAFDNAVDGLFPGIGLVPAPAIEARLRALCLGIDGCVEIPVVEDRRFNELLKSLDPSNRLELRACASARKSSGGIHFLFGEILPCRHDATTLIDEVAISAHVVSSFCVSSQDFQKPDGPYASDVIVRERILRAVIQNAYLQDNGDSPPGSQFRDLAVQLARRRPGDLAEGIHAIELRSVVAFRGRKTVKHETGIRDSALESALQDSRGHGPLYVLGDLSVSVTELLACLEVLVLADGEGASSLDKAAALFAEIRDSFHIGPSGERWFYLFKSLSAACLVFALGDDLEDVDWDGCFIPYVRSLVALCEEMYEKTYVDLLVFLNSLRLPLPGDGVQLPLFAFAEETAFIEGPESGISVLGSYNEYLDLFSRIDGVSMSRLSAIAETHYWDSITRLAALACPGRGIQVKSMSDVDSLLDAISGRADELKGKYVPKPTLEELLAKFLGAAAAGGRP